MIAGAIFDADGTLLDSMHIWSEAGARYLASVGRVPEAGLAERLFPMTLEESSEWLKARYHLAGTAGQVKDGILQIVAGFYKKEAALKAGAAGFLRRLDEKGVPMAIATSGDRELLRAALERLGVERYFKAVFTCSELRTSKHEPKIYHAAAGFLGVDAARAVVLEDVLYAVRTAREAGFAVAAVEDAASAREKEQIQRAADFYMSDLSDFDGFWAFASAR